MSKQEYQDVFISYNSADERLAKAISKALKKNGISTWFALENILPSQYYAHEIDLAIPNCKIFLLLASSNSIGDIDLGKEGSNEVTKEIELARHNRRIIFPLKLDSALEKTMKYHLSDVQWKDVSGEYFEDQVKIAVLETKKLLHTPEVFQTHIQRATQSRQRSDIEKIENFLKEKMPQKAKVLLTQTQFAKEYDDEIVLLKVITSMQLNTIRTLQIKSVARLCSQLQMLLNTKFENIGLYLMAILSKSYFELNAVYDSCGGYDKLHSRSKSLEKISAKYILMSRYIDCKNIEREWKS